MSGNCGHMSPDLKSRFQPFAVNPFKIAFCGYSGSGKTTLIAALTKKLSSTFQIGYYKHDAHFFQMDKKGKDTYVVSRSGAMTVSINDASHSAEITCGPADILTEINALADLDVIFIEGYKDSEIPKIIFIDQTAKILNEVKAGRFTNILAFVGTESNYYQLPGEVPYFHRDDIVGIKNIVQDHLYSAVNSMALNGLVLTGGKSSRMRKDKALIQYHDRPQFLYCNELLAPYCHSVFISSRQEQKFDYQGFPVKQIHDQILNSGPLGGIITALKSHPRTAWLVIACDLPFIDPETIEYLIKKRNPFKMATCFLNTANRFPEPLCTIYEPKSLQRLIRFWSAGCECPRKILAQSNVETVQPFTKMALQNINRPDEYEQALKTLCTRELAYAQ